MPTGIRNALFVVSALLGAAGWWLPWVTHRNGAAALVLLGLDLGDFWKFTRVWQVEGLLTVERHLFFLPPALAAIMLALWLGGWHGKRRWLFLPLLLFLALVPLPALDILLPLLLPGNPLVIEEAGYAREFTFQLWLSIVTLMVIAAIPLWGRLPSALRRRLIALVGVVGAIAPAYALWYSWELMQGYYGGMAQPGIGVFVSSAGFIVAAGIAALTGNGKQPAQAAAPPPAA